ncbi:MAG TPA: hypothetical protein VN285_11415 [Candidatus Deferrimicrobium sp.]|nr:hypothetical protein [Candidatus Deferrimicrobium sp.]
MISSELMAYCIVAGGLYLLVVSLLLEVVGRALNISRCVPKELLETAHGVSTFAMCYLVEFVFFVVIPTLGYGLLYAIIPLWGVRAGIAVALPAFLLGAVPALIGLSLRLKLPMPYLLFFLLGLLVKLGGALSVIAYVYAL